MSIEDKVKMLKVEKRKYLRELKQKQSLIQQQKIKAQKRTITKKKNEQKKSLFFSSATKAMGAST